MRVLLTGANGRIGRWVARELLGSGVEEVCCPNHHAFDILAEGEHWSDIFAKPWDVLIHCAWITSHGDFWSSLENIVWAKASERLFDRFYAAGGQRIVGVGTCAEYEWPSASLYLTEASVCNPATLYGLSKLQTYTYLEEAARRYERSFAWSRIFFTFGAGESDKKLIPSMVAAQLAKTQMRCGHEEARRDFLDFESVGRLIARVSLSQVAGAINIGSGEAISLGEIYNDVLDICGGETFVSFSSEITRNQHFVVPDISKLRHALNFHCQGSVRSKIREYVKYLALDRST
ncbi:MAG: NAD(P)-dependent oxidoreductase [Proteobacteria bacterium]|nr:NAD(P)-dependent oxidoreductase [Pseudomonadota bacterium]